jgi:hypothetical protein
MNNLNLLQAFAVIISVGYCGFMLCLFVIELIEKIENYFRNSSNGKATVRDEVQSNKVRKIASKVGQFVKAKIGCLVKNKPIQKAIRSLLEKAGVCKRKLHGIVEYKKKK